MIQKDNITVYLVNDIFGNGSCLCKVDTENNGVKNNLFRRVAGAFTTDHLIFQFLKSFKLSLWITNFAAESFRLD